MTQIVSTSMFYTVSLEKEAPLVSVTQLENASNLLYSPQSCVR
jgi:hypothetical protein